MVRIDDILNSFSARQSGADTSAIQRAYLFGARKHEGQARKSGEPYMVHPMAVSKIVADMGLDAASVCAALLHDTLEDTHLTLEDLHRVFGETVAAVVAGCSEPDKSVPWEERKRHTFRTLKTAPVEVRLVTCADKLDNVLSLIEDVREQGEALWDRFNRGKEDQAWYYRTMVQRLSMGEECSEPCAELLYELAAAVESLFGPL